MPATTWPANQQGRVLSGDGAKVVGREMYDRDQCLFSRSATYCFGEVTETSLTYVTKDTMVILIPPWCKTGHTINATAQIKGGGGSSATWRIEDNGGTAGTAQTEATTTYTRKTSVLTIPSDSWAGTERTMLWRLLSSAGGTVSIKALGVLLNVQFRDG